MHFSDVTGSDTDTQTVAHLRYKVFFFFFYVRELSVEWRFSTRRLHGLQNRRLSQVRGTTHHNLDAITPREVAVAARPPPLPTRQHAPMCPCVAWIFQNDLDIVVLSILGGHSNFVGVFVFFFFLISRRFLLFGNIFNRTRYPFPNNYR